MKESASQIYYYTKKDIKKTIEEEFGKGFLFGAMVVLLLLSILFNQFWLFIFGMIWLIYLIYYQLKHKEEY